MSWWQSGLWTVDRPSIDAGLLAVTGLIHEGSFKHTEFSDSLCIYIQNQW